MGLVVEWATLHRSELSDITTILESNGFFVRPVEGDKPDIAAMLGGTLRIICSRTAVSVDPVEFR